MSRAWQMIPLSATLDPAHPALLMIPDRRPKMSALTVEDVQCLIDRAKRENIEIPIFCTYHFLPVKYLITSNSYITETLIKGLKDVKGQYDYVGNKHDWYSNYWFAYAACRKLHRK